MSIAADPMTAGAAPQAAAGTVLAALADIRRRIARAAERAGRPADAVTLVAVSKTVADARLEAAIAAGLRVFGENRVQEAEAKWPARRAACPGLELHLIGPLQTNKVKEAAQLFDVIETVDRPRLAEALAKARESTGRGPRCLIQVNTGEEPQKAGIGPREADAFIRDCRERLMLPIEGLMCIPPAEDLPAPHFALLADIAERHGLKTLSMGMSADFEAAIALGATHVRIGSALFGTRRPEPKEQA